MTFEWLVKFQPMFFNVMKISSWGEIYEVEVMMWKFIGKNMYSNCGHSWLVIRVGGDKLWTQDKQMRFYSKEKRAWMPEWMCFSELGCKIHPAAFWHILCIVGRTIPNIHPTISVFEQRQHEHMVFQDPIQSLQAEIEAWMGGDGMLICFTPNSREKAKADGFI